MTQRSRKTSVGESTRNLVMNANAIKGYAAYAVAVCGPREQFGTLAELRAEAHETETGEDDEEQRRQPFDGGASVLDAVLGNRKANSRNPTLTRIPQMNTQTDCAV